MNIIDVAAAIIFNDEGKVLIAKRKSGKSLENHWEFPGGKIEKNETEVDCLKREMLEEFGIKVDVKKFLITSKYDYKSFVINLKAYHVSYISGDFQLREHSEIKWIKISEHSKYMFAPADIPINEYLVQNGY